MKRIPIRDSDVIQPGDMLRHRETEEIYVVVNYNPFTAVHVIHYLGDRKDWERVILDPGEAHAKEFDHNVQEIGSRPLEANRQHQ